MAGYTGVGVKARHARLAWLRVRRLLRRPRDDSCPRRPLRPDSLRPSNPWRIPLRSGRLTRRASPGCYGNWAVAAGDDLPGRQARDGPRRGRPPQHPLPRLPGPDGHGPATATGWPSAPPSRSGNTSTSRPSPPGSSPPGRHDACFLPRSSHVTGNIQIHEMAWGAGGELWVVNTRFSCLCTLDRSASFTPRWRPPFVSELDPYRPLPPQRPGHGRGQAEIRHRAGRNRHHGRLAGEQGQGRRR